MTKKPVYSIIDSFLHEESHAEGTLRDGLCLILCHPNLDDLKVIGGGDRRRHEKESHPSRRNRLLPLFRNTKSAF